MDPADGEAVRLVEVRDRFSVLAFVVFDHQVVVGPVRVDRELGTAPRGVRVAQEPVESVLPQSRSAEDARLPDGPDRTLRRSSTPERLRSRYGRSLQHHMRALGILLTMTINRKGDAA